MISYLWDCRNNRKSNLDASGDCKWILVAEHCMVGLQDSKSEKDRLKLFWGQPSDSQVSDRRK